MEQIKKRDLKKLQSKDTPEEQQYRMKRSFKVLVGDDTGLLKKVNMQYRYQTDILGADLRGIEKVEDHKKYMKEHFMKATTQPEASESEDEDEGATKKQKSGADEEKILKA